MWKDLNIAIECIQPLQELEYSIFTTTYISHGGQKVGKKLECVWQWSVLGHAFFALCLQPEQLRSWNMPGDRSWCRMSSYVYVPVDMSLNPKLLGHRIPYFFHIPTPIAMFFGNYTKHQVDNKGRCFILAEKQIIDGCLPFVDHLSHFHIHIVRLIEKSPSAFSQSNFPQCDHKKLFAKRTVGAP